MRSRRPNTAGRRGCWSLICIYGNRPSGCAASGSATPMNRDSGKALAITITETHGASNGTGATDMAAAPLPGSTTRRSARVRVVLEQPAPFRLLYSVCDQAPILFGDDLLVLMWEPQREPPSLLRPSRAPLVAQRSNPTRGRSSDHAPNPPIRSEERRVGKECRS